MKMVELLDRCVFKKKKKSGSEHLMLSFLQRPQKLLFSLVASQLITWLILWQDFLNSSPKTSFSAKQHVYFFSSFYFLCICKGQEQLVTFPYSIL